MTNTLPLKVRSVPLNWGCELVILFLVADAELREANEAKAPDAGGGAEETVSRGSGGRGVRPMAP